MEIKHITPENFHCYGTIIEYPGKEIENKEDNLFRVLLKETAAVGWRIAYLIVRDKTIDKLEHHPRSFETLEPVAGRTLVYLTNRQDRDAIECFYLDKPVILNKNIWHGIVTLDKESEIKITENVQIECVYWLLGCTLAPAAESLDNCR